MKSRRIKKLKGREIIIKKKFPKKCVKKNRPRTRPVRVHSLRWAQQPPTGPAVAAFPLPPPNNPFRPLPSLTSAWYSRRRRRRPKPGAEAFVGLFAGDEHPPGTPTPSFPFPSCCAAEHRNPNQKLFSYSTSLLTSKFCQKYWV